MDWLSSPNIIPADMADHPVIKNGLDLDDASNGKFLPVPDSVDTTSVSPYQDIEVITPRIMNLFVHS